MAKRPAAQPKASTTAALAAVEVPALFVEFQAALASWIGARDALRQAGDAATAAQTAIEALPGDATDAQKHDAQVLQAETLVQVDAAVAAVVALPDLPAFPERPVATASADLLSPAIRDALALVLPIDAARPRNELRPVTVTGPKVGRYRVGYHFTDVAQPLLVSVETYKAIKGDPALTIAFDD